MAIDYWTYDDNPLDKNDFMTIVYGIIHWN